MVRTQSTMPALATVAAPFSLPDVIGGAEISLQSYAEKKALLVMFICNHCPFVQHIKVELAKLGHDYAGKSLGIVAISSNDADTYKDDSPEALKAFAEGLKLNYALCYDADQSVAKAYKAACTPDFFLFDSDRKLVYRGQLDDSRPDNGLPVTGKDMRAAIDALLSDKPVPSEQKPSIGCNIKWKAGNEPKY